MHSTRALVLSMVATTMETLQLLLVSAVSTSRKRVRGRDFIHAILLLSLAHLLKYYQMPYTVVGTLYSLLVDFIAVHIFFEARLRKKLYILALFYLFIMICDVVSMSALSALGIYGHEWMHTSEYQEFLAAVLSKLLGVVILIPVLRGAKIRSVNPAPGEWMAMLVSPVVCAVLLGIEFLEIIMDGSIREYRMLGIIACAFLIINYLLLWNALARQRVRQMEKQFNRMAGLQRRWVLQADAGVASVRKLYHDMRRHITYILGALYLGNLKDAQDYIHDWDTGLASGIPHRMTGNATVDIMLHQLAADCDRHGIVLRCKGELPAVVAVPPFSLARLVGNLADNAVKACEGVDKEDRFIDIQFQSRENVGWMMRMQNPAGGAGLGKGGTGLQIVRDIAKEFNGHFQIRKKGGLVMVTVMFTN